MMGGEVVAMVGFGWKGGGGGLLRKKLLGVGGDF